MTIKGIKMSKQPGRNFSPDFKAEVALAAIGGGKSLAELSGQFQVEPEQITAWRLQLQEGASALFAGSLKSVPRALQRNPFGPDYAGKSLSERLDIAAEASAHHDRTIGIVMMQVTIVETGAEPPGQALLEDICDHLNAKLRASDHAEPAENSTLAVYLSLLNTLDDLHSIARRVHGISAHYLDNSGYPQYALSKPGVALHPLDGARAEDLQAAAIANIKSR